MNKIKHLSMPIINKVPTFFDSKQQKSFAISQTFKGKVVTLENIFTSGNCTIKGGNSDSYVDPKVYQLEELLIACNNHNNYTDIDPMKDRAANIENNNIYKKGFYIVPTPELKIGSLPRKFDSNCEWIGGTNRKFSSKATAELLEYRTFSSKVEECSLRIFGNSTLGYLVWYWPKVPRKFSNNYSPIYESPSDSSSSPPRSTSPRSSTFTAPSPRSSSPLSSTSSSSTSYQLHTLKRSPNRYYNDKTLYSEDLNPPSELSAIPPQPTPHPPPGNNAMMMKSQPSRYPSPQANRPSASTFSSTPQSFQYPPSFDPSLYPPPPSPQSNRSASFSTPQSPLSLKSKTYYNSTNQAFTTFKNDFENDHINNYVSSQPYPHPPSHSLHSTFDTSDFRSIYLQHSQQNHSPLHSPLHSPPSNVNPANINANLNSVNNVSNPNNNVNNPVNINPNPTISAGMTMNSPAQVSTPSGPIIDSSASNATFNQMSMEAINLRKFGRTLESKRTKSLSFRHPPFITPDNSHLFLFHYLANEGISNSSEEELNQTISYLNNKRKREEFENYPSNGWSSHDPQGDFKRRAVTSCNTSYTPTSYSSSHFNHTTPADQSTPNSIELMPYFDRSQFDPQLVDGIVGRVPPEKNKIDFVIGNFKPGCYVQLEQQKDGVRIDGPIEIVTARSYFQITHFWRDRLTTSEFVDLTLLYPNATRIRERIQFEILPPRSSSEDNDTALTINSPSQGGDSFQFYYDSSPGSQSSPGSDGSGLLDDDGPSIDFQSIFAELNYSNHLVSLLQQQHQQQILYHQSQALSRLSSGSSSPLIKRPSPLNPSTPRGTSRLKGCTSDNINNNNNNNNNNRGNNNNNNNNTNEYSVDHLAWKSLFPPSFSEFSFTRDKKRNLRRNTNPPPLSAPSPTRKSGPATNTMNYHPLVLLASLATPSQSILHLITLFGNIRTIDKIIRMSLFTREQWLSKNHRNETPIDCISHNQFLNDRQRHQAKQFIQSVISNSSTLLPSLISSSSSFMNENSGGNSHSYTSKHADFAHFAIPCDRSTKYSMLLFISDIHNPPPKPTSQNQIDIGESVYNNKILQLAGSLRSSTSSLRRDFQPSDMIGSNHHNITLRKPNHPHSNNFLSKSSRDLKSPLSQSVKFSGSTVVIQDTNIENVRNDIDLDFPEGRGAVVAVVGRDPKRRLLYSKDTRHPNLTHLAVSSSASAFLAGYSYYDDEYSDDDSDDSDDDCESDNDDDFPVYEDVSDEEEEEEVTITEVPNNTPFTPRLPYRDDEVSEFKIESTTRQYDPRMRDHPNHRQLIRRNTENVKRIPYDEVTVLKRRLSHITHRKNIKNSTGIAKVDIGISIIGVQVRNLKRGYPAGVVEEFEMKDNIVLVASGKNDFLSVAVPLQSLSSDHIDQVVAVPLESSKGKTIDHKGRIWISCFVHSTPVWFLQHLVASTSLTNRLYEVESQLLIRAKKASIELRRLVSNSNLIEQFNASKAEEEKAENNAQVVKAEKAEEKEKEKEKEKEQLSAKSTTSPNNSEMIRIERYRSENDDLSNLSFDDLSLLSPRLDDVKQSMISSIGKLLTTGEINILCVGDVGSGKSSFILTTLQACGIHRCLPEINSSVYDPSESLQFSLFNQAPFNKRKPHTLLLEPYRPFHNFKILDSIGFDDRRKLKRKEKSILQNAIFGRFPEYKSMKKLQKKLPRSKSKKVDIVLYFTSIESNSVLSPQKQFEAQQRSSLWNFVSSQSSAKNAPILGVVITNIDRIQNPNHSVHNSAESLIQRRCAFFESYGVPKERILRASSYNQNDISNFLRKQERNLEKEVEALRNAHAIAKWTQRSSS